jgi:hypothetical protein
MEKKMKKMSLVLLLFLCACGLAFAEGSYSRTSLFNEANGMIDKRLPSGWTEGGGLYYKSQDFAVGKEYTALHVNGNMVEAAIVGCLFTDNNARTVWLKESYDALIADRWEFASTNDGNWVLLKGNRAASSDASLTNDGKFSASVVFVKWR